MQVEPDEIQDSTIFDVRGDRIGSVADVYVDDETERSEWLLLDTGFLSRGIIVPVRGLVATGDGYGVPFTREVVMASPDVDHVSSELGALDERELCAYYHLPRTQSGAHAARPDERAQPSCEICEERPAA